MLKEAHVLQIAPPGDDVESERSKDHDRVGSWTASDAEIRHRRPSVERKVATQRISRDCQDASVRAGIRHDENDVLNSPVVPELAHDASLDGLEIRQSRLGFERVDARMAISDRVPRARVTDTDQWHLCAPPDRIRESISNPSEQADLRDVSDRVGIWVKANARNKTDRDAESTKLFDPDVLEVAALIAVDLTCGDADRTSYIGTAQSAGDPCQAKLGTSSL